MKKTIIGLTTAGLLTVPFAAEAATREFPFAFTQDCLSVEGDSLDTTGDGICNAIDYWRFYTSETDDTNPGAFIDSFALAEFTVDTSVNPPRYVCELNTCRQKTRHNRDFGADRCMQLTAVTLSVIDGTPQESVKSNVGACRDVDKGNPNQPLLEQNVLASQQSEFDAGAIASVSVSSLSIEEEAFPIGENYTMDVVLSQEEEKELRKLQEQEAERLAELEAAEELVAATPPEDPLEELVEVEETFEEFEPVEETFEEFDPVFEEFVAEEPPAEDEIIVQAYAAAE